MKLENEIQKEYETVKEEIKKSISHPNNAKLIDAYQDYIKECKEKSVSLNLQGDNTYYRTALTMMKKREYFPEEITNLCFEFISEEVEKYRVGLFLSAAINNHYVKNRNVNTQKIDYKIVTEHFSRAGSIFNSLGIDNNGANILIIGNVSVSLGARMKKGSIYVKGNASSTVGFRMSGGSIHITGDIDDAVYTTGYEMSGGKIVVDGTIQPPLSDRSLLMKGGEIWESGKCIFSKIKK